MHRFTSCRSVLCALSLATLGTAAQAQVSFGLNAGGGQLGYVIQSNTGQKWDGSAKAVNLSADVAFANGFYVGVSNQQSQSGTLDFRFNGGRPSNYKFKRNDSALTMGFAAANRLNSFVGVRTADTEISNTIGTKFNTTGYFVGLSYPVAIGAGTLALTGAVGANSGKWTDTGNAVKETAYGLSGGLRYAHAFTPNISASLGVKAQRYAYDFQSTLGKELEESVRTFDLGLNVSF